jgi:hypothetical protein
LALLTIIQVSCVTHPPTQISNGVARNPSIPHFANLWSFANELVYYNFQTEWIVKGIVFVELLKMAEFTFGEEQVDKVLDNAELPSGGAYTAVGYYECAEMVILVDAFSRLSGIPKPELERQFGNWVMDAFKSGYPEFFNKYGTAFDMLEAIENDIHIEVRKLYPDAELPSFNSIRNGDTELDLEYRSERPLAHFCHGLVECCFTKYGEKANIKMVDKSSDGQGCAYFNISRVGLPGNG